MTHEELYKQSDQYTKTEFVDGDYGRLRHIGQFTYNNPYLSQLRVASNNDDKDALYAKAVEWQANYYNTLEEREYNSPTNRIARDKIAGINSDIVGATAGSSSASPAGSAIPAPQNDVQYSSVGSRTGRVIESINTACNVVSTIASFGTATIGAIRDIKTMPAQVSLADSQAYIADKTKDAVVESTNLSNIQQRLALVNQLSKYFTPDSNSEDYTNVLSTLGIAKDSISHYESAIRNYHTNPAYQAEYEDNLSKATEGKARNAIYTSDVLNTLFENTKAIQLADQNITLLVHSFEKDFNEYLSANGYGTKSAQNILGGESLKADAIELSKSRLKRDIQVFAQNLEDVKDAVYSIDARIEAIAGNAKNERRMISDTEQFEIDTLRNMRDQLMTLGSSQLQAVYSIIDTANAIMYQNDTMLNTLGEPIINPATPRFLRTINTTFGYMVNSNEEVMSTIIGSLPYVGGLFTAIDKEPEFPSNWKIAPYRTVR